jgi:hypothetical protein
MLELDTTEDIPSLPSSRSDAEIDCESVSRFASGTSTLNHLYKESASDNFNFPKDKYSWLAGKEINIETPSLPEFETGITSRPIFLCDFVLCYRIQECGLIYER